MGVGSCNVRRFEDDRRVMSVKAVLGRAAKLAAWLSVVVMTISLLTDRTRVFSYAVMAFAVALLLYEHCLRRRTTSEDIQNDKHDAKEQQS